MKDLASQLLLDLAELAAKNGETSMFNNRLDKAGLPKIEVFSV